MIKKCTEFVEKSFEIFKDIKNVKIENTKLLRNCTKNVPNNAEIKKKCSKLVKKVENFKYLENFKKISKEKKNVKMLRK